MIGRTISHYRITTKLGAGGMGIVYAAEDARLGRQVALKFVSSDYAHDEQALARLRSEAKAASALNHPHICTIHDIGEDDGHPFIVMELMKGQTLRERLNQGPLKLLPLVDVGIEVADALHAAHHEGIIHRDIKPGNVFVTERGHVKILDFGLAKLTPTLTTSTTTDPSPHTSVTGVTHGTPAYMSPEQATGEVLDGRSDLFSLGVMLYECATGQHPFPGKTSAVVLAGILDRTPVSPLTHNPDLPPRLVEIISNCLEKDRELRYQSAADLRADLKRLRRDLDSGSVRAMERSASGTASSRHESMARQVVEPLTMVANAPSVSARSRRTSAVWILGTITVLAVIAAAVYIGRLRNPASTTADATPSAPVASEPPVAAPLPPPTVPASTPVTTDRQLALATASLNAGNYRAALTGAREVLALEPGNVAAERVRDQATAMLARFDNELADARRRLASGDLEGATRALERARAIDATSPTIAELGARLSDAFRTRGAAAPAVVHETAAEGRKSPVGSPPPPAPAAAAAVPLVPPPTPANVTAGPPPLPPPPADPVPVARPSEATARAEPPPVKPVSPSVDSDDAAIRQVIATYGRAIEGKDIRLFRSVKPNLTAEEERRLQDGFRAVTSQRVSLAIISIDRKGDQASAVIRRRDEIEAGGRKHATEARQVLTLARGNGAWVITEIR
jgi:serine/threonine protein kinase